MIVTFYVHLKFQLRMTPKTTTMKTKLKNLALTIIFIFFISQKSAAQFEIGFGAGACMYFGDLGGSPKSEAYHLWDLDYQTVRGMGQAFIRMPINENTKAKLNFAFASVAGNDKFAGDHEIRERGISMEGKIVQLSGCLNVNLIHKHDIYGIVGLGYLLYSPIITQNSKSTVLSGSILKNSCISIPLGIGFKIANLNKNSKIAFEIVTHYVNSDWVDGLAGPTSFSNDNFISVTMNYSVYLSKCAQNPSKFKTSEEK